MKGGNNMAKIGKRAGAKKYAELRKLQTRVNHMLYTSTHIEKTNPKRQAVLQMKRQFYKSRGIKNPAKLSFKSLSTKDIKAYKELLKSIESNTYINPEKFAKFKEKMKETFKSQGWNFEYEEIEEILESDIVNQLAELGMKPSMFWSAYDFWVDSFTHGVNDTDEDEQMQRLQDFWDMLNAFLQELNYGDMSIDQFFVFANEFITNRNVERAKNLYT